MEYNTQQRKLPLPQYGRSVQNMVDFCQTLKDRAERQQCANTIVNVMGSMFPRLRDSEDFKHKLWDHLAIMSDFKLDIDYPFEMIKKENLNPKPESIPYHQINIRYRYYGYIVEMMIKRAVAFPEGDKKNQLIRLIANYMKRSYLLWNKENVDDQKILNDLQDFSSGTIHLTTEDLELNDSKDTTPRKPNNQRKSNNQRKQNSGQRRKF
ncbi:PF14123 domain protein [Bacteroidetes bacterium oral taxon 272 str. F0290]|nr:PF14123 domain protein [Bacteroidetes bacterium oral taxon 272 str. F0290]